VSMRRDVDRRLHGLAEIEEIMNAMKNLALIETRRLARVRDTQRRLSASIDAAMAALAEARPDLAGGESAGREALVVLGSERGFCGDFNETLRRQLPEGGKAGGEPALFIVGARLSAKVADAPRIAARLEGASTLEEVPAVLLRVMDAVNRWLQPQRPEIALRMSVLYHPTQEGSVELRRLDPFGERRGPRPARGYGPRLNLEPGRLLGALTEHYLFAALHDVFYSSLMAENQRRMQHMELAMRRLSDQTDELRRRRNALRQEEITEEIEVIMLSARSLYGSKAA
jgi:F-type H+-transporting ATPase subunit gamma